MFQRIQDNFFIPLSCQNRALYWECLQILFNRIGISFSIERSILMQDLIDYFERPLSIELVNDDTGERTVNSNPTDRASYILRSLQNYGWIEYETDRNYIQHVNFSEPAIKIYKTIEDIEKGEQVEYSGSVLRIYSQILADQSANPDMLLENIYNDTIGLITELQTLNANIKHYIDGLTKKNSPGELMKVLMDDYFENIINKAYHRLVTSDNISRVRPDIIRILTDRGQDQNYLDTVALGLMDRKDLNREEAIDLAKEYLYFVVEEFRNMDSILDEIHHKNTSYISSAINRTKFLLTDSEDTKGQLKEILSLLNETINEHSLEMHGIYDIEYLDQLIHVFSSLFPDENSLYSFPTERQEYIPELFKLDKIDPKEKQEHLDRILKSLNNQIGPDKINTYVLDQLGDKDILPASQFPLNSIEDFIRLIYIQLFGNRKNMVYSIEYDNRFQQNIKGFSFKDFLVRKKAHGSSR